MTDDTDRRDATVNLVDEAAARASGADAPIGGFDDDVTPSVEDARRHLHQAWDHSSAGTALPGDARLRQAKRAVLLALRPVTSHQVPFNQEIAVAVKGLAEAIDLVAGRLDAADRRVDTAAARAQASIATTELTVDELADTVAELTDTVAELFATMEDLAVRNQRLELQVADERAETRALRARLDLVARAARNLLGPDHPDPHLTLLSRQLDASYDELYEHLENAFRGPRDHVRGLAEGYLPDVEPLRGGPVLDLGCGRGEWLDVLRDHDIDAYGLDSNETMVERCRERGLDARVGDALQHLAELPESSLAAVTGMHIAEHLAFDSLVELLDRARIALRPGGLLILETPNPTNLTVGAAQFYLDPTHVKPLHPDLMEFLALERGFAEVEIRYLHPADDVDRLRPEDLVGVDEVRAQAVVERINWALFGPRDFAVLARKPAFPATG